MLTLKEQKLDTLYRFYIDNEDEFTIEEIAEGIGVTPKTIFNRYHSREEMEKELQSYWRMQIVQELEQKMEFCNNPVEKLLFLINEILSAKIKSHYFFVRELAMRQHFGEEPDAIFEYLVRDIINEDTEFVFFSDKTNVESYSRYFVFVVFNILSENKAPQYVDFLIQPILTIEGMDILSDIDVERLLE